MVGVATYSWVTLGTLASISEMEILASAFLTSKGLFYQCKMKELCKWPGAEKNVMMALGEMTFNLEDIFYYPQKSSLPQETMEIQRKKM